MITVDDYDLLATLSITHERGTMRTGLAFDEYAEVMALPGSKPT